MSGAASAQDANGYAQLLQQNPNGGQVLIGAHRAAHVRQNPSTLHIRFLVQWEALTVLQKTALAKALAQAMKQLVKHRPISGRGRAGENLWLLLIQTFKTAATDAFGDVKLGAIGGGPPWRRSVV